MKKPYYIDFPQENFEGHMHKYRCAYCQQETTTINGKLEAVGCSERPASNDADDFD